MHVDLDTAMNTLRAIIAEKGEDFVYAKPNGGPTCYYFDPNDRSPSCIVGHALARWGVTPDLLIDVYHNGGDPLNTVDVFTLDEHDEAIDVYIETDALMLLGAVQVRQDRGKTWGVSFQEAQTDLLTGR